MDSGVPMKRQAVMVLALIVAGSVATWGCGAASKSGVDHDPGGSGGKGGGSGDKGGHGGSSAGGSGGIMNGAGGGSPMGSKECQVRIASVSDVSLFRVVGGAGRFVTLHAQIANPQMDPHRWTWSVEFAGMPFLNRTTDSAELKCEV